MRALLLTLLLVSCADMQQLSEEYFIEKNGHQIHVQKEGAGKPILFTHGGYLDVTMWEAQVNAFKDSNLLIRFSDLGHGKTKRTASKLFGYEIIHEIMASYPNEKFVLVGLSWGAMLSVDYTLRYPERVEKLVLVSPGLNGWEYFQDSLALKNSILRQEAVKNLDTAKAAALFHKNWVVGPRRNKEQIDATFYASSLKMIERNMKNHWQEDWSTLDTIPARDRLAQILVPTYVIVGEEDAIDILLVAEEYDQKIKNSKKIVIDDVAHLLTMESPFVFNEILRSILEEK